MKKHLIAAAVAAAVAVPAMAQVTVSGNLEVGYTVRDNSDGVTQQKGTTETFVGTPHLKVSGSEDLGGGLKASFDLTTYIETPEGTQTAATTTTEFQVARINLSGAFGTISAGRFDVVGRDAGGVYRFMGDIGRIEGTGNPGGDERNNIAYTSPSFSGFQFAVSKSGAGRTTATAHGASASSGLLRYSQGNLNVAYGTTTSRGAVTAADAQGTDVTVSVLGAGYNFGMARVGAFMMDHDNNNGTDDVKGTGLNVAVPMGKMTVGLGLQNYDQDNSNNETDMLMLGLRYDFSKRTALWATYQEVKGATSGVATGYDTARGFDLVGRTGGKNSGYGVALVHSF